MAHYNFSNVIITCINFPLFFISIASFVGAVYVKINRQTGCTQNYMPVVGMIAGTLFLVMSVTGLLGALRKSRKLVLVYLCCVALSFLAVVGTLVFTVVVLSASPVDVMVANREFQLRDFSQFVRRQAIDGGEKDWGKKRNCLVDDRFCREMRNSTVEERQRDITRMVGCCLPPTKCGFKSINNGTAWVVPEKIGPHPDCALWSSDMDRMCYDCESCKAAHVAAYVLDLRGDIMSLVGAIFFHILCFVAGYFTAKYGTNDINDLLVHEGPS